MYVILALLSPLSTGVYVMIYDLLSVVFIMCHMYMCIHV